MAEDWGFMPDSGRAFFISYNSTDSHKAAAIAKELKEMGYPVWYDIGLKADKKQWKQQISESINSSYAVILCVTSGIFDREKSFVINEFDQADAIGKPVIPVFLDRIQLSDVDDKYKDYLSKWKRLRGVKYRKESISDRALRVARQLEKRSDIDFTRGKKVRTGRLFAKAALKTAVIAAALAAAFYFAWTYIPPLVTDFVQYLYAGSDEEQDQTVIDPYTKHEIAPISDKLAAGDHVYFGKYPAEESSDGGSWVVKPIEWRVLAVSDGNALLITERLIDCGDYSGTEEWMNGKFRDRFTSEEKQSFNSFFFLSADEAEKYFSGGGDRMAAPTDYAIASSCRVSLDYSLADGSMTGVWWLADEGGGDTYNAFIDEDGSIDREGIKGSDDGVCVRPAIWLKLPVQEPQDAADGE